MAVLLYYSYSSDVHTVSYFKMEVEWSRMYVNRFYLGGTYLDLYEITASNTLIPHYLPRDIHVDIRHLEIHKKITDGYTDYIVFTGNDGGVSKRNDWLNSISVDLSKSGLNITQYYGIGIPADGSKTIIGGTQDGNFETYKNGNWTKYSNIGDAAEVVFDYTDPKTAYMVIFGDSRNYLKKTINGGIYWDTIGWDVTQTRNDAPLEMSNIDSKVLLLGGKNVWKTSDGGSTFSQLSFQTDSEVTNLKTIRFAPSNNDVIYAAYDMYYWNNNQIRLIKSSDGGLSWIDITPREQIIHLWSTGIFDLAVDPQNPDLFYITLDRNRDGHKVYKGEGSSTITWTNMSEGITNLPVNCIELLKGSTINEMFIGTDDGVYYRNNTLDHWVPFGTKLPIVSV